MNQEIWNKLLTEFEQRTRRLMAITHILRDKSFKNIVEQGDCVIPYILKEIEKTPSVLVYAVEKITGKRHYFSESSVNISDMCRNVVKWGKREKII